jgi:excisionase family DNA binding protein
VVWEEAAQIMGSLLPDSCHKNFSKKPKIARFSYIFRPPAMRSFYPAKGVESGMETYLTISEVAEAVKLSEQTIRRYVLNHEIPYHKIKKVIRFKPSEVERWIESGGLDSSAKEDNELEGDLFAGLEAEQTRTDRKTGEAEGTGANGETGEEQA